MHEFAMLRAIELSRRGYPAPNPHVGCVLVKNGVTIAEGWHDHHGGPHAEVVALESAVESPEGATAYVTLEPCNHTGRTGPCSQALIRAGVKKVYIAVADPNPKASGGIEALKRAGIEVEVGLCAAEAEAANPMFLFAMRNKRPWVTAKAGASLDGRIALPTGESKWITSPEARAKGRLLRATHGAVLVGRKTVTLDDPELTVRDPRVVNPPVRVVIDPQYRLAESFHIFNQEAKTLRFTKTPKVAGDLLFGPAHGKTALENLLDQLYQQGIIAVLIEGGAATIAGFISEGLVNQIELFVAPKLLGEGSSWLEGYLAHAMVDVPEFEFLGVQHIGPDLQISARPKKH